VSFSDIMLESSNSKEDEISSLKQTNLYLSGELKNARMAYNLRNKQYIALLETINGLVRSARYIAAFSVSEESERKAERVGQATRDQGANLREAFNRGQQSQSESGSGI